MKRLVLISFLAASPVVAQSEVQDGKIIELGVEQVGRIEASAITESSGLVASRRHPGVFWTHNDKGNKPRLFAITRDGRLLTEVRIAGAKMADWEDIAIDDADRLYLGDIGNNVGKRTNVEVYRINEPDPRSAGVAVKPDVKWRLEYPAKPFDAESLFVYGGVGYIISKVTNDRQAQIYRFDLSEESGPSKMEWVAKLPVTSPVTGATISPEGKRLGLVCKAGAYVFHVEGDVAKAGSVKPWHTRFRHESIEACCFVSEGLLVTAESREIFLFTDEAFR